MNSKSEIHIKISQELQDSRQLEFKDSSPGWQCQICSSLGQDQYFKKETLQTSKQGSQGNNRKQLQDQEIRAELNKHFGHPSQAVFDEEADKTGELRDSDYSNEQFSKLPMFINSGLAMDGLFDDSEDESDKLCYPWDGTQAYSLFDVSPSCSSFNSPCRDSVSPPKSLFSQRSQRTRSRSRSFPQRRSCSRSPYSRSRSRSPCSRSSSRYSEQFHTSALLVIRRKTAKAQSVLKEINNFKKKKEPVIQCNCFYCPDLISSEGYRIAAETFVAIIL